jgi:hypothetical protein
LKMIDPDPGRTVLNILLDVAAQRRPGIRVESKETNHA